MRILVCYDVVADRRRNRLFRALRTQLVPVQKSVFEGDLSAPELTRALATIRRLIDPEHDTVRVYSLCGACRGLIELLGVATPIPDAGADTWVGR